MPKTLSLLAVLKKIDTKGLKSLSDPQWNTFLASDTEPNEIKEKIKKLEGYENTGAVYDATGELIVEDNNAMIERFRQRTGRAQGRESLKVKQSKISVKSFKEKFLDKDEKPVKPDTTGASDLVKVDKPPDLSKPDSEEKNEETEGLKGIRDVLDDILKVLRLDFKGDRKEARDAQKQAAKDRRIKKEENIEKKEGAGIGKAVKAMLSPFSNIWKKILKFLKFTLIGVLFNTVWKWFADPENKKKVEAIGRFFKDWWPALAIAATAFLTPLGALVASSVSLMAWAIPALYASILANPWAIPILATLGTAGYLSTQKKKVDKNVDKSVKESSKETALDDLKKEQKERDEQRNPFQKFLFGTVMGEDAERQKQIERVEGMNKGGQVPGSGNKDTVPAMLTPGEFVMSKGAVQKYGADTLAGMNAAAGGTNRPTLMGGYNEGGFANMTNTMSTSGSGGYGKRYVSPEEAKERLAARGMPSMELFDGTVVPNFGKMGADSFMDGIQLTRSIMVENEADPAKIAELDNFVATNPYAQPEKLQSMINRVVPGSTEQVLGDLGDSITASA